MNLFETAFAQFCCAPSAVGVASGLDAIEVGLRAGGAPVFVDVDEHGILDLDRCDALLRERSDIRYCVPVHGIGQSVALRRRRDQQPERS